MEIILAGVVLLAIVAWLFTRTRRPPAGHERQAGTTHLAEPALPRSGSQPSVKADAPPFMPAHVPAEVQEVMQIADPSQLEARQTELAQRLKDIPQPPRTLQSLTSPAFLQKATSAELAELVLSEPHVAAKVLATVNSPLYGLRTPVTHIGQGITFLGLNTVRSICLQYLLNEAFPAASGELRPMFDRLWKASAIGSELCAKLSAQLGMPQGGVMVTQVVLSYLGPMAALTLMPLESAQSLAQAPLLTRCRMEREALGMTGMEIGQRVMKEWGLPVPIIDGVSAMNHMLDTPVTQPDSTWTAIALSYWCARIGEKLARGDMSDTDAWIWQQDHDPETAIARHYLAQVLGDRLTTALQDPKVSQVLKASLGGQETSVR